ncbi:MAG: 2-methylfumaryl-CoA isomerase, partial [Rhodobacteraceae bacterium]
GLVEATGTADAMAALARRIGCDLAEEGARWAARHEITAILAPWFAARKVADFAEGFTKAGLTWSEFRTTREAVMEDPDLSTENPMFSMLSQPGLGSFPVPGHAATFSAHPRTAPVAAPRLGEHTEEILGDVARLDDAEIARLFDKGIVQAPDRSAPRSAA